MKLRYALPLAGLLGCGEEPRPPLEVVAFETNAPACNNMPMLVFHDRGYMIDCGDYFFMHDESNGCINFLSDEIPEIRQLWQDFDCDGTIDSWYLFAYSESTGDYIYADDSAPAGNLETSAYFKNLEKIGQKACEEEWKKWL